LLQTEDVKKRSVLLDTLFAHERELAFVDNESTLDRRDLPKAPVTLSALQAVLGEDEVLIEYVLGELNAFCIAIKKNSADIVRLPEGSKLIGNWASSYLSDLKNRKTGRPYSSKLFGALLGPVLSKFRQSRLVISPDGILRVLPFESLLDEHDQFLVRSKVISYTPSASLLWAVRTPPFHRPAPRPLLAVGDVEYGPLDVGDHSLLRKVLRAAGSLFGRQLHNLPSSRDEVLSIARSSTPGAALLMGGEATETKFKSQPLSDFRVIHLAVHSVADPLYPFRSSLVLGPDSQNDGLLQVREIMRLRLNADLVSLSACETGVGPPQGEAGMASLEQAFLLAGAKSVVGSLWQVEDQAASSLMKRFYDHLAMHEDRAVALSRAKLDLLDRDQGLSPYYWAGFTLWGEGSSPVSFDL
jgi:CHAT domain-containing protein